MNIHVVLLSGGSGKRLWPLSNAIRSKQFLQILPDGRGGTESMLQRIIRQIRSEFPAEHLLIATSAQQADQVRSQVGSAIDLVQEPARRDTFGAIALAGAYLRDRCGASEEDVIAVVPVDVFAQQHYCTVVRRMCEAVDHRLADLLLMGIPPVSASPRFGYIEARETGDQLFMVTRFVEKPSEMEAGQLVSDGAFWNGGVFALSLAYLAKVSRSKLGEHDYHSLLAAYGTVQPISFDHAVTEQARSVAMIPYTGTWKDLGAWDSLVQEINHEGFGPCMLEDTKETVVVNEMELPVVVLGTEGLIIAASPEGVLVTTPGASGRLRGVVDRVGESCRFEQFPWGSRTLLGQPSGGTAGTWQTNRIDINSRARASLSYAPYCQVTLVCGSGEGHLAVDDTVRVFRQGDHISMDGKKLVFIESMTRMVMLEIVVETSNIFP